MAIFAASSFCSPDLGPRRSLSRGIHHHRSSVQYIYSTVTGPSPEAGAAISNWRPRLFDDDVAAFARCLVASVGPKDKQRAKALLFVAAARQLRRPTDPVRVSA